MRGNMCSRIWRRGVPSVAVDRVDDFAYAERDVMGRYLAQAKEVNLRANEKATADLELVHVGRGDAQ